MRRSDRDPGVFYRRSQSIVFPRGLITVKKLLALVAVGTTAAVLAVPALAATKSVTVGDDFFVLKGTKPTVTVHRNDYVKWIWRGHNAHNVVATKGPVRFQSPTRGKGFIFTRKMTKAGTYTIVCTIHTGMKMTLKVT